MSIKGAQSAPPPKGPRPPKGGEAKPPERGKFVRHGPRIYRTATKI